MGEKAPAYGGLLDEIGARLVQVDRPVTRWNVTTDHNAIYIKDAQSFEVDGTQVVYDRALFRSEVKHAALEALMQSASTNVRSTIIANNSRPVLAVCHGDSAAKFDQFTDLEIGAEEDEVASLREKADNWRRLYQKLLWIALVLGYIFVTGFFIFLFLWIFGPPSGIVQAQYLGNTAAAANVAASVIDAMAAART